MDRPPLSVWPLWLLMLLGVLPELTLTLADQGLIGSPRWRPMAYSYGGFYSGLLRNWTPNFAAQPWAMFGSYWLLHAGLVHLVGNMLALAWLWHAFRGRLSGFVLIAVYLLSALGGAAAFGLLNTGPQPMIGASGAIFGLAGLWVALEREGQGNRWAVLVTLGLVALNALIWVLESGQLAWEGHLGGFLVGAGLGLTLVTGGRRAPL